MKLNKRRKGKRRLPASVRQPLTKQEYINENWSMDFMSDSMVSGRKFRTLNIIDDCTREALTIEIDTSLSAKRATRVLDRLVSERGKPKSIRVDNGPEFISYEYMLWCKSKGIVIQYIQPGKPMQNGYIERFNRLYREAVLDAYLFFELEDVKLLTQQWIEEYNERRPHEGLNNPTPVEYKKLAGEKKKTPLNAV